MHNKFKISINLEIIVVIIIACCMLLLNSYTTRKLQELEASSNESMFIRNDLPYMTDDEFTEEILEYKPDACKMIEMYDDSYNLMLSIRFDREQQPNQHNIYDYPGLVDTLRSAEAGQADIGTITTGYDEKVYFQWVTNSTGKRRLIIVYSTRPTVDNLWVFSAGCYFVLFLVFFLLIRLHTKEYRSKIEQYSSTSTMMRD